jgi:hypothetical protein
MLLRRVAREPSHLSRNAVSSAAAGERAQSRLIGNLVVQTADSRRAEVDVLRPVTRIAQRRVNARI